MNTIQNKDLKRRILEISHRYKLSHLGSCLTAVDIIDEIYQTKKKDEKFILSAGHAGLALYVVLEKYRWLDAEKIFLHHGVHPDRCSACGLDCSAGSLGHGLPIAVGMALADRSKNVYCLISDGECSEGSIWEAMRIVNEQTLNNLHIYVNANGYGAYKDIDLKQLYAGQILGFTGVNFRETNSSYLPFLNGLDAHYHVMTEEEYEEGMEILNEKITFIQN